MNPTIWAGATLGPMPMKTYMLGGGFALTEAGSSRVPDAGCAGVPGPEECAVGERVVWFSTMISGATHFVHDNVQMPGVVKLSPRVVIVVGTAPHEVVNTTTVTKIRAISHSGRSRTSKINFFSLHPQ
jgi:hypothetical protein